MDQKMMEYSAPPPLIHQQKISAGISPNPASNIAFENVYGQARKWPNLYEYISLLLGPNQSTRWGLYKWSATSTKKTTSNCGNGPKGRKVRPIEKETKIL